MRERKTHIKLNGKAVCGVKAQKHKIKFVTDADAATCRNCLRAVTK